MLHYLIHSCAILIMFVGIVFSQSQGSDSLFTLITEGSIVSDSANSFGANWVDYDDDGDLDLFVANNGQLSNELNNFLYRNEGDGSLSQITTGIIVNDGGFSYSSSWGDYDNDGDLDVFVANNGNNFLYRNGGNGNFTKITEGHIVNDGEISSGCSWGDYDNDGDLDLFVANLVTKNFLYRNDDPEGSLFTRITEGDIVNDEGNSSGCSWGDYDNDGDLDLFVTEWWNGVNFLYRNDRNGVFTRITQGIIASDEVYSRGCSWSDYDNDGDLDLFLTTEPDYPNVLYRNEGEDIFTKITGDDIVSDSTAFFGSSWGDYDNDGDLDLFAAGSSNNKFLYQNNGDGTFAKIIDSMFTVVGRGNATSWSDYDEDGFLDLFIARGITFNNLLYRNNSNNNHWIDIKCIGTISNTSAIGTKVRIKATINGNSVWQLNEISGQTGFGGQNSLNTEFGLGDATMIDSIKVEWPSGIVQVLTEIAVDQHLTITEEDVPIDTTFTRITEGDIVNDRGASMGCGWGDYDNDGYLDIFIANNGNNFLHRNNGDGTFTKITSGSIVSDGSISISSSWGDYDDDGDLDLFVSNANNENNFLYENNGDGTFNRITTGDIVNDGGDSWGCSWVDFDYDSDLDLFVANGGGFIPNQNNFLYRNNGDGTFTKISSGVIVNDGGTSSGCSWADYDNDGDLDLFVANSGEDNFLYRNDGNGNFFKIVSGSIVNDGGGSIGCSWTDYDNDGDPDLFVANGVGENNFLYENNGDGSFAKIINGDITNNGGNSLGSSWGDYDNDGDPDLFVANNDEDNFLYRNDGNGNFIKIVSGSIVNDGGSSIGCSWADYDNDGDLDLFVANGSIFTNRNNFLYANNGNDNHWLNINCVGTVSNTSANGTKVRVKTNINGSDVWQLNELSGQTGFGGQNSLNTEFGLGDATIIDSTKVEWPSGIVQVLTEVPPNQFITITEEASLTIDEVNSQDSVNLGSPIEVSVLVSADLNIREVRLLYREGGESVFQSVVMVENSGLYQEIIPGSIVGARGVEFLVEALDSINTYSASDIQTISIRLPDQQLNTAHNGGSTQNAYRLRSFPLAMDDSTVAANLPSGLAQPDSFSWRLWDIGPNRANSDFPYREYRGSAFSDFAPGKAMFLITKENVNFTSGPGLTVSTVDTFKIQLQPGWNMISSPFNFQIPKANIQPANLQADLCTYNGQWDFTFGFLEPWEGYMIKVTEPQTLSIYPSEESINPQSEISKRVVSPSATLRINSVEPSEIAANWFIQIKAKCEAAQDNYNMVGVAENAAIEWDRHERYEPPPIGEFVSVFFPRRDWKRRPDVYTTDFRPPTAEGYAWDFEVKSNIYGEPVTLDFENLNVLPPEFEVRLIDLSLNYPLNLLKKPQYIFRSNDKGKTKSFRLFIGTTEFIKSNGLRNAEIPETFELAQNFPNPFNPATTIKFGLPEKSPVFLIIYNILGEAVATLINNVDMEAGWHLMVWDGKDHAGNAVSSGLYLYQLRTGDTVLTRKMMLIK